MSLLLKKLEGKVAIITGGASGIGEATARLFSAHGARIVIADIQDEKGIEVAESIGFDICTYFHCDVADEEQVQLLVEWTLKTHGQIDIMFSNAGIFSRSNQTVLDLNFSELNHPFLHQCCRHGCLRETCEKEQLSATLPMKKLEDKVAIVTGGASGIGEATAHLLAENGVKAVVIADIQDEKGRLVAESIGSQQCSYFRCDVSDENQVKALVEWTVQTYGQLDIMFSNAGISSRSNQTILDLDFSEYDRLFEVNTRGMAACVKHAARAMVEQGVRGSIVCTASVAASRGGVIRTDYVMAKHAVLGLVRSASQQLGVHGIRVNSVSPSAIATPLTSNSTLKTSEKEVEMVYGPLTSLKGIQLTVRNVAEAVVFLVSEQSAFITGHDLSVDGGLISLPGPNT